MAKSDDAPLEVVIPKAETPAWSRVGVVAAVGFVVGMAWPRLAGLKIGPSVPGDGKPAAEAPVAPAAAEPPSATASAAANAPAAPAADANVELAVVGNGKVVKCSDKKEKKADCDEIAFDKIALAKLKDLAKCPSALGLEGKISLNFDVSFDKKEVTIAKPKKSASTLPSSTVNGVAQCAAKALQGAAIEEIEHKHHRYVLSYDIQFYPPGKHPDVSSDGDKDDEAPKTDEVKGESAASGSAIVSWDTALVRKDPKDGEVVARVVRGTKVKIVSKQNDWYKVETGGKTGWVYRGAIGM